MSPGLRLRLQRLLGLHNPSDLFWPAPRALGAPLGQTPLEQTPLEQTERSAADAAAEAAGVEEAKGGDFDAPEHGGPPNPPPPPVIGVAPYEAPRVAESWGHCPCESCYLKLLIEGDGAAAKVCDTRHRGLFIERGVLLGQKMSLSPLLRHMPPFPFSRALDVQSCFSRV